MDVWEPQTRSLTPFSVLQRTVTRTESVCMLACSERKKSIANQIFKTKLGAFKGHLFPNGHEFESVKN